MNRESPLGRLYELGGHILLLEVDGKELTPNGTLGYCPRESAQNVYGSEGSFPRISV